MTALPARGGVTISWRDPRTESLFAPTLRQEGRPIQMNITITFRHMEGTEAVKKHAHEKLAKLQKFLRTAMTAQVTLSVEGLEHIADVNIASGSAHFPATERREGTYASID